MSIDKMVDNWLQKHKKGKAVAVYKIIDIEFLGFVTLQIRYDEEY